MKKALQAAEDFRQKSLVDLTEQKNDEINRLRSVRDTYIYIPTYRHTHILKAWLHACVHAYFYKDTHLYHISIHVNNVTKIFKYMHTYEF